MTVGSLTKLHSFPWLYQIFQKHFSPVFHTLWNIVYQGHTLQCRYNTVDLLWNDFNKRTIAHSLGLGTVCILWVQSMMYLSPCGVTFNIVLYLTLLSRYPTVFLCDSDGIKTVWKNLIAIMIKRDFSNWIWTPNCRCRKFYTLIINAPRSEERDINYASVNSRPSQWLQEPSPSSWQCNSSLLLKRIKYIPRQQLNGACNQMSIAWIPADLYDLAAWHTVSSLHY